MAFFELVLVDIRCTPTGRKGPTSNSCRGGDVEVFNYVTEFVGEGSFVGDNLFWWMSLEGLFSTVLTCRMQNLPSLGIYDRLEHT